MILDQPITTGRLMLRTLTEADAAGPYLAWMTDPEVLRFLEVRHSPPQTAEILATFIAACNAHPRLLLLGICREGRHIGNIKLGPLDPVHARADLGFLIGDRTCWGRGYASEAIAAVAQHALVQLGLRKVTAGSYAANAASAAALHKAGFITEAVLKDHWTVDGQPDDGLLFARFPERDAA